MSGLRAEREAPSLRMAVATGMSLLVGLAAAIATVDGAATHMDVLDAVVDGRLGGGKASTFSGRAAPATQQGGDLACALRRRARALAAGVSEQQLTLAVSFAAFCVCLTCLVRDAGRGRRRRPRAMGKVPTVVARHLAVSDTSTKCSSSPGAVHYDIGGNTETDSDVDVRSILSEKCPLSPTAPFWTRVSLEAYMTRLRQEGFDGHAAFHEQLHKQEVGLGVGASSNEYIARLRDIQQVCGDVFMWGVGDVRCEENVGFLLWTICTIRTLTRHLAERGGRAATDELREITAACAEAEKQFNFGAARGERSAVRCGDLERQGQGILKMLDTLLRELL